MCTRSTLATVASEIRTEHLREPELSGEVLREIERTVGRYRVGSAEVAVHDPGLPAALRVVGEVDPGHVERFAVEVQRRLELIAIDPAFLAALDVNLVPVRLLFEQLNLLAALGDIEHRVAPAGSRVQLDERIVDGDLLVTFLT